jgi:hypothetical protein
VKGQRIFFLILSAFLTATVAGAFAQESKTDKKCCCDHWAGDRWECQDNIWWQADCIDELQWTPHPYPESTCQKVTLGSRCKPKPAAGKPSLSEWVLIVLALSVGGFFVWQLKRRRKAVVNFR